jgi:phosphoserine aminotransferase
MAWTPTMLSYQTMVKHDSMLNTPPCWNIYLFSLVLDWVRQQGGIPAMEQLRQERAGMLYELLDESRFYSAHARRDSRSFMNVTFHTPSKELDAAFIAEAGERGLLNVKGYKTQGGLRVSLYNAMPMEGAVAIRDFMKEFEVAHHV